jgi:hypothetical protein
MATKLVSVFIDENQITVKKLDPNDSLDVVRISNSNLFRLDGGDKIKYKFLMSLNSNLKIF